MPVDEDVSESVAPPWRSDGGRESNGEIHYATYDLSGSTALSTTIVQTLAGIAGTDVTELGFSLYDHIDVDALDGLFEPRPGSGKTVEGTLTFVVPSYRITVHGNGDIVIEVIDTDEGADY